VALCGQEYGLVPALSVFHNIYMGQLDKHRFFYNFANLLRPFKAEINAISSLAKQLELNDVLFKPTEKLSGGQQQRVALGRALFQNKSIFIGDEPVSSVDEVQSENLIKLMMARHNTIILTLHNVDLALRFCDRVIGLRHGTIELDSAVKDISATQLRSLYQD
jgi:phosphonate transport system ATP-binding protein